MYDEKINIYEIEEIPDFINRLYGYFSDLDEIKEGGKFLVLKDFDSDKEIIRIECYYNEGRVKFRAKLLIIDKDDSEYYINVVNELLILTFIKFRNIKIVKIARDEAYYYFEGEVETVQNISDILH